MSESSETPNLLNLTFGVEIEHLFGIKQDEVAARPDYDWLRPENCPVNTGAVGDPLPPWYPHAYNPNNREQRLELERVGLRQAGKIVRLNAGPDAPFLAVRLSSDPEDVSDQYLHWKLTLEDAVPVPTDADQLMHRSTYQQEIRVTNFNDWQLTGLELISRPLKAPELDGNGLQSNGLQELQQQLDTIPKLYDPEKPYFFTTGPELGSVHVHVGVQPGAEGEQEDLSTEFLQHLAFICMVFEDVITLLHHPERQGYQGTKAFKYAKSNRTAINAGEHYCALAPQFSCEEALLKIFEIDPGDERDLLNKLLNKTPRQPGGKRERYVNFTNALGEDQGEYLTRTVEFRQHHGTLSTEDVCEWVFFATALARAAERKQYEPAVPGATLPDSIREKIQALNDGVRPNVEEQAKKYIWLFQDGNKKKSLEDLFELLQLPVERRKYWWARARKMKDLANTDKYKGRSTCEYPCECDAPCKCLPVCDGNLHCNCKFPCNGRPVCTLPPRRDCAEWDTDEWNIPSYDTERGIGKDGDGDGDAADPETQTGHVAAAGAKRALEDDEDDDEGEGEKRHRKQQRTD
jgi:hypothetical protein